MLCVLAVGLATAVPAEAASGWRLARTYSSSVPGGYATATAVAAFGNKDAWVFSADRFDGDRPSRPAAHHWNGKAWRKVPLPAGLWGDVRSVHRSSPTNMWAVGGGGGLEGGNGPGSYALRWNGKKWSVAKKWKHGVHRVTVADPSNVWFFGVSGADHSAGTWHFNGRKGSLVRPVPRHEVVAPDAVSKKDVWAVGRENLIARYDGSRWSRVSVGKALPPSVPYKPGKPYRSIGYGAVRAFSAGNVWVTGAIYNTDGKGRTTVTPFLLHRKGTTWRRVPVTAERRPQYLNTVHPDGRGGLWIFGSDRKGNAVVYRRTSAGKWLATAPTVKGHNVHLSQISHIPGTTALWAVGQNQPANDSTTSLGTLWHLPR